MPRRMSFSLTKSQFLDGSKTVTRRLGWKALRAGDELIAVEKCMGLKKGERQVELGRLVVTNCRQEPLNAIEADDVTREGFPEMTRLEFIGMFCRAMRCGPCDPVTRIEFRKLPEPRVEGERTLRQRCEDCGAKVKYVVDFGQKWSWCTGCTPVVTIDLKKLNARMRENEKSDG